MKSWTIIKSHIIPLAKMRLFLRPVTLAAHHFLLSGKRESTSYWLRPRMRRIWPLEERQS